MRVSIYGMQCCAVSQLIGAMPVTLTMLWMHVCLYLLPVAVHISGEPAGQGWPGAHQPQPPAAEQVG